MDSPGDLLVALAIIVGLIGIVIPILPGLILIVGAVVVWAVGQGGGTAWSVALLALVLGGVGSYVKYAIPKKQLNARGVPTRTLVVATLLALIGFFVAPVIGGPIAFVGWIYFSERMRVGPAEAWPATKASLGAVATSIGIELATGLIIATLWVGAALAA
jgi:uncharacterized protein